VGLHLPEEADQQPPLGWVEAVEPPSLGGVDRGPEAVSEAPSLVGE
jgi:hypothetical protein